MRFSLWNHWLKPNLEVIGRPRCRVRRGGFVPRLEVLEDRCLLSIVPTLALGANTTWLPVAGASGTIDPVSTQTISTDHSTSLSVTFHYSQAGIQLQYIITGNLNVVIAGTLTSQNAGNTFVLDTTAPFYDTNDPQAASFNLTLSLFGSQTGLAAPTNLQVAIQATETNNAASLSFMISGADISGARLASSPAIFYFPNQNITTAIGVSTNAQTNDIAIQSLTGIPSFSITFARPNVVTNAQTVTTSGTYSARDSVGYAVLIASSDGVVLDRAPKFFNPSEKGLPSDRGTISTYNSLVVADSGPGFHLTLSITQEISYRSSSPAAQTTWTGLRPPLEAALRGRELRTTKVELSSEDTNARSFAGVRDRDEADNRPMEIMVANILTALQQAKAEDRTREIAQTAAPETTPIDMDPPQWDSQPVAFWPREEHGEMDALGNNIALPLNELLGETALKEPMNPVVNQGPPGLEQSGPVPKHSLTSRRRTASRLSWLPLAESVVAVFAALGWPGAIWLGQPTSWKHEQRPKNPAPAR